MPHCNRGRELRVGDHVNIECVVESVQEGTEFCNVTVRTVRPMPPYKEGTTIVLNTVQTESLPDADIDDRFRLGSD